MRRRGEGDASLLIGLVLGLAVGTAIALVVSALTEDKNPHLPPATAVSQAKQELESKADDAKERLEGAAEGAAQ